MSSLEELLRLHAQNHPVVHIDLAGTAQLADDAVVFAGSDVSAWPTPLSSDLARVVVVVHSMDDAMPVRYPVVYEDYDVKRATVIARHGIPHMPRLEVGAVPWRAASWSHCGEWDVIQLEPAAGGQHAFGL